MPKRVVHMLADTNFWKSKGKDLFLSTRIDPATTPTTANCQIRVSCEHCGKQIRKPLNRWLDGHTMCVECEKKYGEKKQATPMLTDTEFWQTKGKDLLLSTRSIDPTTTPVTSNRRIRVACEHCGKEMNRKLRRWYNGETLCWDCKPKYLAEQEAIKQAEAKRNFGKGTLWDVLPWQVILMWDWKKNEVAPWEVRAHSRQVIHLVCDKCGYEFNKEARVVTRHFVRGTASQGTGRKRNATLCDCCSGRTLVRGVNDLATTHPDVAAHWHPTKNGDLTPRDVTAKYGGEVWWIYDNGAEGKSILWKKMKGGEGFSHTGNMRGIVPPLSVTHSHLVPEWDVEKNGGLSPDDFTYGSHRFILWTCSNCGYEWNAQIKSRALMKSGCPRCAITGTSKGEELIIRALEMLGMRYKVENALIRAATRLPSRSTSLSLTRRERCCS